MSRCPRRGTALRRQAITSATELPRDRSILLVRLMAAGLLLTQAIEDEELAALPLGAHERAVTDQILLNLQHALGKKPSLTPEEQEFIVTMQNTWEKARDEGVPRRGGDVLTVRRVLGFAVPDAARERILAQKDLERLERWLEKAIVAASVGEVSDDPS